jgi:c-di-GMP-binding flagellar brake protein YcgR
MTEPYLKINQRIHLIVEEGPYKGTYLSKVADIEDDNIRVTPLYLKGVLLPVKINLPINILFVGSNAAYLLETRIIGRQREPVALLNLKKTGEIERLQRRDYFRVEVRRGIKYRLLDQEMEPISDFKETLSCDLSGNGIRLIIDQELPGEGLLEIYLHLPEIEDIPIYGKIVRLYKLADGMAVGVRFIEVSTYVQEQIITWIFAYQRELRKKGLL